MKEKVLELLKDVLSKLRSKNGSKLTKENFNKEKEVEQCIEWVHNIDETKMPGAAPCKYDKDASGCGCIADVLIEVSVGNSSLRQKKYGDYLNSIEQITQWYLNETNINNKDMSNMLKIYADKILESES